MKKIALLVLILSLARLQGLSAQTKLSLDERIAERRPGWLAYEIDAVASVGFVCCLDSIDISKLNSRSDLGRIASCRPERPGQGWSIWRDAPAEHSGKLRILLKVDRGRVERVHAYSSACRLELDAPIEIFAVDPRQSLELLAKLARASADDDDLDRIVATIGLHTAPAAGTLLADLAQPVQKEALRRPAIFWLGQSRGDLGLTILVKLVHGEKDQDLREHIVFSISQTETPDNRATTELIQLIRGTRDPELRRQALFWLGESKDPRALDLIAELLD